MRDTRFLFALVFAMLANIESRLGASFWVTLSMVLLSFWLSIEGIVGLFGRRPSDDEIAEREKERWRE